MAVLISAILVLATGCMHYEFDITLKSDNTGSSYILTAVSEDMLEDESVSEMMQGLEKIAEGIKAMDYEGGTVVKENVDYLYNSQRYKGTKVNIYIEDISEFFKLIDDEQIKLIDLGNGYKRLELYFESDATDLDVESLSDEELEMIAEFGMKVTFSISTDFEVINHNATTVEKGENGINIYKWDMFTFMGKNPGKNLFIEYKNEEAQEPIVENIRTNVERNLELDISDRDFHGKALNRMGLLLGSNGKLDLDKQPTRTEGAIMYARLLGVTDEIEKFAIDHPDYDSGFTDVPDWAKPTINYLHSKGLVYGISKDKFGAEQTMTKEEYMAFVLRALGYSDKDKEFTLPTAIEKAKEIGMFSNEPRNPDTELAGVFTRGDLSYISYNALFVKNKKTGEALIERFMNFTAVS